MSTILKFLKKLAVCLSRFLCNYPPSSSYYLEAQYILGSKGEGGKSINYYCLLINYSLLCLYNYVVYALQIQEERHFDPDHVGNSIKALALSVQDTGMFGDLPRPRIMTNPYAKKW